MNSIEPRLEFCTFRDLANPCISGLYVVSDEFCRASMQSGVFKNEAHIFDSVTTLHNVTYAFDGPEADLHSFAGPPEARSEQLKKCKTLA